MPRKGRNILLMLGLTCLLARGAEPEWRGAKAFLQELERLSQTNSPAASATTEAARQLQRDLAAFQQQRDGLSPEAAARSWLQLGARMAKDLDPARYDVWIAMGGRLRPDQTNLADLLTALPLTNAWPLLARQWDALPAAERRAAEPLHLLVLILAGETEAARQSVQNDIKALAGPLRDNGGLQSRAEVLQALQDLDDLRQKTDALTTFRRRLAASEKSAMRYQKQMEVPDLVGMAGSAEAEQLIKRLLLLPNARLQWTGSKETLKLAQRVAVREINTLRRPPWGLVQSADDLALYQALAAKFPEKSKPEGGDESPLPEAVSIAMPMEGYMPTDDERLQAQKWCLVALLEEGRAAEAERLLSVMPAGSLGNALLPSSYLSRLPDPAKARRVYEFMADLAQKKPEYELWRAVEGWAQAAGLEADWIARLKKLLGAPTLKPGTRLAIQEALTRALLADDRVDEAVALLRQALAGATAREAGAAAQHESNQRSSLALTMAKLGYLLHREDLAREGLAVLRVLAEDPVAAERGYGLYGITTFVQVLLEQQRYAEAEEFIFAALQKTAAAVQREDRRQQSNLYQTLAGQLLEVYAAAGRSSDVLALLERLPYWNAPDLLALPAEGAGKANAWLAAAVALHAAGRTAEAVPILKTWLAQQPGDDAGYQALLDMADGRELLPWLDQLYARDRFEERPLIWKAAVLRKLGRLDEAEQSARLALKVDPTDGETRAGDRVRGYAVLADILEARGRREDAVFFRQVVQSVRLAEQGDEWAEVGLTKRSLEQYEKAQALFADAYCVQWRLAERLWTLGRKEEAEKHYAIAFERMPEQFGQVASLCFGCEGVFTKPQSRSVAERVLLRLEKGNSPRPQVFFLLGQLRAAQGRPHEAVAYFRRAAALDPEYLDAWRQIAGLADAVGMAVAERSALELRLLQMDPLGRHHGGRRQIADLPALWQTVRAQQTLALPLPSRLLDLPASRERLSRREEGDELRLAPGNDRDALCPPGEALLQQSVIGEALQWMQIKAMAASEM